MNNQPLKYILYFIIFCWNFNCHNFHFVFFSYFLSSEQIFCSAFFILFNFLTIYFVILFLIFFLSLWFLSSINAKNGLCFICWQDIRGEALTSSSETAINCIHHHHLKKLPSDSDIENYAQTHLNRHKKGLFGKKVSLANMLAWSKVSYLSFSLFYCTWWNEDKNIFLSNLLVFNKWHLEEPYLEENHCLPDFI